MAQACANLSSIGIDSGHMSVSEQLTRSEAALLRVKAMENVNGR